MTAAQALSRLLTTIDQAMGTVFYGPVLRAARNSSLKGEVGHGGKGEDVFQNQLDQILAERVGQATHHGLNETLFDRFSRAARAAESIAE